MRGYGQRLASRDEYYARLHLSRQTLAWELEAARCSVELTVKYETEHIPALHYTIVTMRFFGSLLPSLLLLGSGIAEAASSWGFEEAVVSVQTKGAGVGGGLKDKYAPFLWKTAVESTGWQR